MIQKGLSYDDYAKIDALRYSDAKLFSKSPLHARYSMLHPSGDTKATLIGSALHTAVLEPKRFDDDYAVGPVVDKRTKEGKAAWAAFESQHKGAILLRGEEFTAVRGMAEAVFAHPFIQTILATSDKRELREVTLTWDEPVGSGTVPCKCRIDWAVTLGGETFVLDLKSTEDATPQEFARTINKWKYHAQAASYLHGLKRCAPGPERRWLWVAVEKDAPHGVAIYEASEGLIQQGANEYLGWVRDYAEAHKTNNWRGYPTTISPIDLPKWAWKDEEVTA
jgi:hypothetical protein